MAGSLAPRQAGTPPAAHIATLAIRIGIAFETFENVVGLEAQGCRALRGRDRTHAAAAQQHHFHAFGHGSAQ